MDWVQHCLCPISLLPTLQRPSCCFLSNTPYTYTIAARCCNRLALFLQSLPVASPSLNTLLLVFFLLLCLVTLSLIASLYSRSVPSCISWFARCLPSTLPISRFTHLCTNYARISETFVRLTLAPYSHTLLTHPPHSQPSQLDLCLRFCVCGS